MLALTSGTLLSAFGFACLGAIMASFLLVVAERVHTGQAWHRGRSRCNACGETLRGRDLVPVLSWLLALGRCRSCGSAVPPHYALAELGLALLFALSYLTLGWGIALPLFLVALAALFYLVAYDLRHLLVPPVALATLFATTVAFSLATAGPAAFALRAGVALGIALFFLALTAFSRGRAMGLGDAPVAFALSLLVGTAALPGLLFSFWIGALIGLVVLVRRPGGPTMGIEVPFVPFLALGYLLAYFTAWNPLPFIL